MQSELCHTHMSLPESIICACRCRSRSFAYCCFRVLISKARRSRSLLGAITCNAPIVEGKRSEIENFVINSRY